MTILTVLEWMMTSNTFVTACVLLMFVFGIIFKLIRGT